ncbi:MAG: ATP-dependent helicase HrpB [Exilibacterium sp.]
MNTSPTQTCQNTASPAAVSDASDLPIHDVIDELKTALGQRHECILEAPPGAGKTTVVPLALLDETWLAGRKIIVLEPRRLAARAAAQRMAQHLNEPLGKTVGYRVRLERRVSAATRIEVVTEGILTRRLQSDPSLADVSLLVFDEFHERSLDADLGLALALQSRELFRDQEREALKILVMSATLDGAAVAELLRDAPVVRSSGRAFPVTVNYSTPWQPGEDICARTVAVVRQALAEHSGSLLVFLPGQREIKRVQEALRESVSEPDNVLLTPLYGDLKLAQQQRAIAPAPQGRRKIVLATPIAESSLTIEGISVVVDAGLSRQPRFDPRSGMTRLQTRRVSQASSEQRRGRAGRLQAGICYRLWSGEQQRQLAPHTTAEILQADLTPLALQLIQWGANEPGELLWLDPPPSAGYQQALVLLSQLGAVTSKPGPDASATDRRLWQLTPHGEAMAQLPLHPRLAHMLLVARNYGLAPLACDIAALLGERDPLPGIGADIGERLSWLRGERHCDQRDRYLLRRLRQQSRQYLDQCRGEDIGCRGDNKESPYTIPDDERGYGFLLACAYPDRIAQRAQPQAGARALKYRLSNGRAARFVDRDTLEQSEWLAVAQLGGREDAANDTIFIAAPLDARLFEGPLSALITERDHIDWDDREQRFVAERQRRVGALLQSRQPLADIPSKTKCEVLCRLIRRRGLQLLPWSEALQQWRARVSLLRGLFRENTTAENTTTQNAIGDPSWPDVSDRLLLASLEQWLAPWLEEVNHIDHFARLDLASILSALLPWPLSQRLDELAPRTITVPSGRRIPIDYRESPPVLAVRLQEMFGCEQTPRIAGGRLPLKIHLLSPAQRPLQVTQDLASFWRNVYPDIKKTMKGRYPKHHWPDDPLSAVATARAKPRKTTSTKPR